VAANRHATTIDVGLVVTGPEGARRDLHVVAEGDARQHGSAHGSTNG